jgi:hypothetical protein
MTNIKEVTNELTGEISIVIDNGDGSFTSMTKARYDELEAAKENGTIS